MDPRHLDALAKRLGTLRSRRTALGGVLAGLLLPLEAAARGKGKGKGTGKNVKPRGQKRHDQHKGKGNGKDRGKEQGPGPEAEARGGPGGSLLAGGRLHPQEGRQRQSVQPGGLHLPTRPSTAPAAISAAPTCAGPTCSGANLTKANLSGACLVDATLSGATVTNNTNMYNAIFCRTTMPDGSINNSGCSSGTPCCPTCDAAHLCPSGCCNTAAGTCGVCPSGSTCGGGNPGIPGFCGCTPTTCQSLGKQCGSWPNGCGRRSPANRAAVVKCVPSKGIAVPQLRARAWARSAAPGPMAVAATCRVAVAEVGQRLRAMPAPVRRVRPPVQAPVTIASTSRTARRNALPNQPSSASHAPRMRTVGGTNRCVLPPIPTVPPGSTLPPEPRVRVRDKQAPVAIPTPVALPPERDPQGA